MTYPVIFWESDPENEGHPLLSPEELKEAGRILSGKKKASISPEPEEEKQGRQLKFILEADRIRQEKMHQLKKVSNSE